MRWLKENTFSGFFLIPVLFLFVTLSGKGEGTRELNSNSVQSTELYICNDFTNHCTSSAGLRSQFAAYDNTQSAVDVDRLYFVTSNASEVVYMGFNGSGLTNPNNPQRHIVFRIKNLAGSIVLAEQYLPTSGTGYISTFSQAWNGPNQLILTPPYNGYTAMVFTPPSAGTYFIEFSIRRDDNNNFYTGSCSLALFDITVGNTSTHLAKPGRLYSKSWQFNESTRFYGKNYFISDDSIVTSAQFSGLDGGHWNQYCNQTGCGNNSDDWITNRKSLYDEQALFPQYKIFLNEPDPALFPSASTLGQIVAPLPYGVQNCQNGHIVFHVNVTKPGNAEITLTFPSPYLPRTLTKAVVYGDNLFDWDGLDGTTPAGAPIPNNTSIQFVVKYINGLTNLPLYDVEGNDYGFTVALVSPAGTTPAVFWDDTNIPGGSDNSNLPGCTSPPGCHTWTSSGSGSGWGDRNTINTWWYNVSTTTAPVTIVEHRGPQSLVFLQQPPQVFCANTSGHVYSVTPDPNTDVYHWSYSPPAGVTITQSAPGSSSVTVSFGAGASSGVLQVYGSNTNCAAAGATSSLAVTINPLPVPAITGPATACLGQINAIYSTESGKTNYQWTVSAGGAITAGAGTNSINVTWSTAGTKTVTVSYTNAYNCTAATPSVYTVTVSAIPAPTITGPASVCVNSTGNIYSTQTGMTSYAWTVSAGGVITAGAGSSAITVQWTTTGAKTVTVNYTNSSNCTAATPGSYAVTVNALPVPTITGPASVCVNSTGNIYSTQTGMTGYAWTVSAGGTITAGTGSSAITVKWTTTGAKTVRVNYANANNCMAATPATYNVTVNALPVPVISGPASVCVNTTGNIYSTQTGMTGYTWTVSAGGVITAGSGASAITVTWSSTGAKTVTVNYTNTNSCSAATPTVYNVTVNAFPIPAIFGPASACLNSTGNVYSTQPGMTNYIWTVSAGGVITAGLGTSAITVTWSGAGAKTITVNYSNSSNCTAATPAVYHVTVYALPIPAISGPVSVCANSSGNVYTTQTGMTGYTWTVSAGGVITAGVGTSAITVTWNAAGAKTVTVNYTNANNCTAAAASVYNVTVNAAPSPVISGPASVCTNSAGNVYSAQTGMTGYTWTVSAGGAITAGTGTSAITVAWNTIGSKTITVNYTNANSCTAASPASYDVTVNALPVPAITGPVSVCKNSTGNVYSSETGMTGYTWTIPAGGAITSGTGTSAIAVTWSASGTKTVTVNYTNENNCTAASPAQLNVVVNSLPDPTFLTGPASVCKGVPENVYTTEPGMTSYIWAVLGGTITSGGTIADPFATVTWDMVGLQSISVNYTDPSTSCTAPFPTPMPVTVKPLPVPTISGPGAACLNTAGPRYVTEAGMSNYLWTAPDGTITPGSDPNIIDVVWNTVGLHTMTATYTGLNGCDPETATQKTILVNTLPAPVLSGENVICTGIQTTYTTDAGMQNYVWLVSGGGTIIGGGGSLDNTVSIVWTVPGTQNVSVNYALETGCSAILPTNLAVTVNQIDTPVIQQNPSGQVCDTTTAIYTTQSGMSGYTWTTSAGGTIISPSNTNVIVVKWKTFGPQWVSVNFTNTYLCAAAAPTRFDLAVNPLPVTKIIEGPGPECESVAHGFTTSADAGCVFTWTVSPVGLGLVTSGQGTNEVAIEWQSSGPAIISVLSADNTTGCFSSSNFSTLIKPRSNPVFTPCFDVVTTPEATRFNLRGASPFVAGQGAFSGYRVSLNDTTGMYQFDPYGAAPGTYQVTYTYTNTYGCPFSPPAVNITVQSSPFICGGDLTDVRDGKRYMTSLIGGKCWMTENLAFGSIIDASQPSTDNCINEKYCQPADENCAAFGGLYQWDELMRYGNAAGNQGICPPGWHVPSETEWQWLLASVGAGITPPDGISGSFLKDSFLTGGFQALMGGLLYSNNTWSFTYGSLTGSIYWTSSTYGTDRAVARGLNIFTPSVSRYRSSFANAFSARCVKN
jgi:uncharacterized protein (TIGR02145 family)